MGFVRFSNMFEPRFVRFSNIFKARFVRFSNNVLLHQKHAKSAKA